MVNALLLVGDLMGKSDDKTLGDFAQKHARFTNGIQKGGLPAAKQLLGQHIEYLVRQLGRGEHLIVTQIGEAGEDVGVVIDLNHAHSVSKNGLAENP